MKNKLNNSPVPGRKRLDSYDRRDIVRSIKFSCNELDEANDRKRQAGYQDFSTFGRDCILKSRITARMTPEQQKILRDIQREGDNLNQIAKACNSGRCFGVAAKALALMNRLDALCDRFDELPSNSA